MGNQIELEVLRILTHALPDILDKSTSLGIDGNNHECTEGSDLATLKLHLTSLPRRTDLIRLVEQWNQDPTSDHTDLTALHFRITVRGERYMIRSLCRCRGVAAPSMIACFQVLAGSAVLGHDRLRITPASSHLLTC